MYENVDKQKENKSRAAANSVAQKKSTVKQGFGFVDNRPKTIVQRKSQERTTHYPVEHNTEQVYQLAKAKNNYKKPKFPKKESLKARADKAKLWAHYLGLDKQWEDLIVLEGRNQLKPSLKPATVTKRIKKLKAIKASKTEVIGEVNATNSIIKQMSTWQLVYGFAKGVGYDQVWKKPDGTTCIVEAKGPGAVLGHSAAKGKQMSKTWVVQTAESMAKSSDLTKKNVGTNILTNIKAAGKVEGYVITSTATGVAATKGWDASPIAY